MLILEFLCIVIVTYLRISSLKIDHATWRYRFHRVSNFSVVIISLFNKNVLLN